MEIRSKAACQCADTYALLSKTALCAALSIFAIHPGFADDSADTCQGQHHRHHSKWAVSISPRYYGLNSNGYASSFSNNGLNAPKSGTVGLDFSIYWSTMSNWQVGLGMGDVSFSNDNGSNTGQYEQSYVGLWLAKEFQVNNNVDISIGGLVGAGQARNEVLSTGANGRTDEGSFILEPKIIVAYRMAPWMKLGVSGSYIEPLAQSDSVRGQNLTNGNISLHGASAGMEFIFGRFGGPSQAEATQTSL